LGLPVRTVSSGGLGVVETTFGTPVTEAANGFGIPVVKLVGKPGLPVTFETTGATSAAQAFLARTSGLDATHRNAYTALIDGLVADGVWARFDMLHVYATQDVTTALLNLVGDIFNGTQVPSALPFTIDRGLTGGSGKYIYTGFIPGSAILPDFTQNSGHVSIWSLTDAISASSLIMGCSGPGGAAITGIHARFTGNLSYFYVNSSTSTSVASPNSLGHFLANRTTSSAIQGYKNGSSVFTDNANTSVAVNTQDIVVAGQNQNGVYFAAPYQIAMASIGASLSAAEATNFYNRLRAYMTAVGVP
jgi:hypothetical protein